MFLGLVGLCKTYYEIFKVTVGMHATYCGMFKGRAKARKRDVMVDPGGTSLGNGWDGKGKRSW